MRILLVEDDQLQGNEIISSLSELGWVIDWLRDGQSAQTALESENFELIILDLGLPRLSGSKLLQYLRTTENTTPVIILTARDSMEQMVAGLDSGADDYLAKPFKKKELIARIRALARRSVGRTSANITYKNIEVDSAAHSVKQDGLIVNIPRREFSLLLKLLENIGKVISREKLMQSLYGWDENVDSNALEVHIHNLRKKLTGNIIKTVRGVGYIIESVKKEKPIDEKK